MAEVISLERERARKPSLDSLVELVDKEMAEVNSLIIERMHSPVSLIQQLAAHIIAAGGKRLRPMLTLASAKMCHYEGDRAASLAACVEFIHTATLLHDDVVDESDLRRGQDSANAIWGNKASVLVGDFLFSRAFELMVGDGSHRVLEILSRASSTIAQGEVMQMITSNDTSTGETAYLEVIQAKTAALFAASARVGAVIAGRPDPEEEALDAFGLNLGIAFQLIDDALDYSAVQATLGKTVGDDFRDGKITLPVILACRRGNGEEREFWRRTMERGEQTEDDLQYAISLLHKHDAIKDCIERARHYGAVARDALGIFEDGPAKAALRESIDFCIERAY